MKAPLHTLFALIAVLSLGVQVFPVPSPQHDEKLRFKGAINLDGWELPGVRGSRFVKRKLWPWSKNAGNIRIFLSILRPRGGSLILDQRAHYSAQVDGTLMVERVAISTSSIMRFDVEGKPFCYVYFGGGARTLISANGQKQVVPLGCSGGVAYYDEDGDGVFERLETLGGTIGFEPRIPKWVTHYVPAAPQHNKALQLTAR
jgi:hypothetical protein